MFDMKGIVYKRIPEVFLLHRFEGESIKIEERTDSPVHGSAGTGIVRTT